MKTHVHRSSCGLFRQCCQCTASKLQGKLQAVLLDLVVVEASQRAACSPVTFISSLRDLGISVLAADVPIFKS